jgi:AcrR family transcriptional regulator
MVKQRIIEEASELFGRSGVKNATMDDIARHLGISKRTIYENFKNKEELLIACIDAFHVESRMFAEKVLLEANNVVEAILTMMQKGAEQTSLRQFNMITDIRKYYPQVFKNHLIRFNTDKSRNIEQIIQRGICEGVFRNELNPEIIAYFFCKQDDAIARIDRDLDKFSLTDIFENMVITFLRGTCTAKGLEIIDRYKEKVNHNTNENTI